MALRSGTHIGPYRIGAQIGVGGMGEVYRAWDTRLNRDVALKVISSVAAISPECLERFQREARAVAALNHPNVLAVHDVGAVDGAPYVVFELLEGETLKERLTHGALPARKVVELGIQICRGLAVAHARGIVHRDLKPANLFLNSDGLAKILDFGLARQISASQVDFAKVDTRSVTSAGMVLGTPMYMSPEQARGQPVDARSDLFSLGAILYEMLTGRQAFEGATTTDVLMAILTKDPGEMSTPSGSVPPALERVIRRCLEKDPEERFQSARDVGFALDAASGSAPSVAASAGACVPRQRRWLLVGAISAAISLAAAMGLVSGRALFKRPLPKITQLTFSRGVVDVARFTADGRTVVYSAFWDGRPPEIFSMRVESPESRSLGLPSARLMSVSSQGELAIVLNPPGVLGMSPGTLARVPLAGGVPRAIVEDVAAADWSSDGHDLAVIRRVGGEYQLEYPIGKVLDRPVRPGASYVRVSPRGDKVLLVNYWESFVYDREGKKSRLTSLRSTGSAAWASNDAVWISAVGNDGGAALWMTTLGDSTREVYPSAGPVFVQDATADGRLLVHHGFERIGVRAKPPGEAIERELGIFSTTRVDDVSADGKQALLTSISGLLHATYLRSLHGGPPVRLAEGWGVALSSDAQWAVISPAGIVEPVRSLSLSPTGPGETRTLPLGGFEKVGRTYWFLDDEHLVVDATEHGRRPRVFMVDLAGGEPRAVTPEGIVSIRYSADNGQLLGLAPDGALARYPMAGGDPQPLKARLPAGSTPVRMSGDGRFLLVRFPGVPCRIERMDLITGRLSPWRVLQPGDPAGVLTIGNLVFTPDGETYAYTYVRHFQDLFLFEGLR